ncbi:TPA: oligoendopeptidase F, partial [Listeria innocua]|nr:oligoendopeptidase F [Listeria innocua]
MSKTNALPLREEVPENLTWDLTTIYPNDEAWEKAFTELQKITEESDQFKGRLAESSQTLYEALQFRDKA